MNEETFFRALGDEILTSEYYRHALTHRSAGKTHNERLEYLGDAVLNLTVADALFSARPHADEGELSRMRAQLVRRESLVALAKSVNLGVRLTVGQGESSTGMHKESMLADALEAVFGAAYLVRGYEFARKLILELYSDQLSALPQAEVLKDSKSRLQEALQARSLPVPHYRLLSSEGEDHQRVFSIRCEIDALRIAEIGTGYTKKQAEQVAAGKVLAILNDSLRKTK